MGLHWLSGLQLPSLEEEEAVVVGRRYTCRPQGRLEGRQLPCTVLFMAVPLRLLMFSTES